MNATLVAMSLLRRVCCSLLLLGWPLIGAAQSNHGLEAAAILEVGIAAFFVALAAVPFFFFAIEREPAQEHLALSGQVLFIAVFGPAALGSMSYLLVIIAFFLLKSFSVSSFDTSFCLVFSSLFILMLIDLLRKNRQVFALALGGGTFLAALIILMLQRS